MIRKALAFTVVLTLGGCEVGPDYRPPEDEKQAPALASSATRDAEAAGLVQTTPVNPRWWLTLKDDKLTELVRSATEANLTLEAAVARVREERALRGVAASQWYPQLSLDGFAGLAGSDDRFHSSLSYRIGFDASWELDVWGGIRRSVEAADADLGGAVEARRDALVSLLGELGRVYVELRGEQRQLEIAKRNIALQEKTLELVSLRKKAGLASSLQVSQATSQLETTRALLPSLEALVARSLFRLSVLCGREPGALAARLATPAPIPAAPPLIPIGLPSTLLTRRPDIRRAERSMAAATARSGVARADLYPKFSLTGNIAYSGEHGVDGKPSFFVGPTVSWPIFTGWRITRNIEASDARVEQAILVYRATVLGAFEEVENALTAYAKEAVRRDRLSKAAREAETAADLAQTEYRTGLVDFLNVLEAQSTLAASQQALAVSEQTLLTDLIAIYKALGGGWETFEDRLAERDAREPRPDDARGGN